MTLSPLGAWPMCRSPIGARFCMAGFGSKLGNNPYTAAMAAEPCGNGWTPLGMFKPSAKTRIVFACPFSSKSESTRTLSCASAVGWGALSPT